MSRYRETLHRWATQYIPDDAYVLSVEIDYDDGYEPTFTDRPESLRVEIRYGVGETPGYASLSMQELTSVGELLTDLFAIEEGPAS